jgi:glucan biosynthesis protein
MRRRNLREKLKIRENVSQLCQAPHTLTFTEKPQGMLSCPGKENRGAQHYLSTAQNNSTGAGHWSQVPLAAPPELHVQDYVFWNV